MLLLCIANAILRSGFSVKCVPIVLNVINSRATEYWLMENIIKSDINAKDRSRKA